MGRKWQTREHPKSFRSSGCCTRWASAVTQDLSIGEDGANPGTAVSRDPGGGGGGGHRAELMSLKGGGIHLEILKAD